MDKWEVATVEYVDDEKRNALLEDGWEPYAIGYFQTSDFLNLFLRRKIMDKRENYWSDYYKRNEKRR